MPTNKILGFFCNDSQKELSELVKIVPKNGHIVELGSFLGKSTVCICEEKDDSVTLHCVDTWHSIPLHNVNDIPQIKKLFYAVKKLNCKVEDIFPQYERFIYNTRNCKKLIRYRANIKTLEIDVSPDLIFLDAMHHDEALEKTILRWYSTLNDNGIFCGHDYDIPYKKKIVDEVAVILNKKVINGESSIWYYAD